MREPSMPDSDEVSDYIEDESRRNPIRTHLRMYTGTLPVELLAPIVASGRDFFHTFVAATLRRRYRRVIPIYLVDDWVVDALGVFMQRGRRVIPGEQVGQQFNTAAEVLGLEPLLALFDRLRALQGLVDGARLLQVSAAMGELTALCRDVARQRADLDRLEQVAGQLAELVQRAATTLERDIFVRPYVDQAFVRELVRTIDDVVRAAKAASSAHGPAVPGTGFGPGRSSGVLYGSIPALKIEGPAILLAPSAITRWADRFRGLHHITADIDDNDMETWFGVADLGHRAAAVGLVNVVQHELTHAMVALPNDAVQDAEELFKAQWALYNQQPGFEEGLCDATAAVATGVALLKARFGISGRSLPRLHRGKYEKAWNDIFPALAETYAAYHGAATDTWLRAWDSNNRDFGAFSGLVKLFATNFSGIDWPKTFKDFQAGRISTGR
jgi:hypothetical protein